MREKDTLEADRKALERKNTGDVDTSREIKPTPPSNEPTISYKDILEYEDLLDKKENSKLTLVGTTVGTSLSAAALFCLLNPATAPIAPLLVGIGFGVSVASKLASMAIFHFTKGNRFNKLHNQFKQLNEVPHDNTTEVSQQQGRSNTTISEKELGEAITLKNKRKKYHNIGNGIATALILGGIGLAIIFGGGIPLIAALGVSSIIYFNHERASDATFKGMHPGAVDKIRNYENKVQQLRSSYYSNTLANPIIKTTKNTQEENTATNLSVAHRMSGKTTVPPRANVGRPIAIDEPIRRNSSIKVGRTW